MITSINKTKVKEPSKVLDIVEIEVLIKVDYPMEKLISMLLIIESEMFILKIV